MSPAFKNPYIGPRTFQKNEGHLFFGREREARDLIALVASEKLVLFYAQSGAGKSSIVNTRLIPNLEKKEYEVLPVGRVGGDVSMNGVENIFVYNLIRGLTQHKTDVEILKRLSLAQFLAGVNVDENGYFYDASPLEEVLTEGSVPVRRALIIDQFEELLNTHPEAWEKREDFFTQLAQAMQEDPYLWVVLVMREDFIAMLDPYAHLLPGGLRVRYYMQRLERDAALEAVKKPVMDLRPFAEGVAETLVDNLARINIKLPSGSMDSQPGQYVEPVQLQVVCYSLWENLSSDRPQITADDLREVGDVSQSLERFYDVRVGAVAKEKNVEERLIREWFEHDLITEGGTRNMVLRSPKNTGGLDDHVIQALQGDLVRAEMRGGQTWYELSHDRLIEPVHLSNTKWFAANLSFFQQRAAMWVAQDRSESLLLRGKELAQAESEQKKRAAESKATPKEELEFLAACIKARNQEKREQRGNLLLRIFTGVSTLLLFAAIAFGLQAQTQASIAEERKKGADVALTSAALALGQKEEANKSLERERGFVEAEALAGQAQISLRQNNTIPLGRLLAVEAYKTNKNSGEILPSVYQALINSIAEGTDLNLSSKTFSSAAFSFDNGIKRLVIDNSLWNLNDNQMSKLDPAANDAVQNSFLSSEQVVVVSPNTDYFSSRQNPYNVSIISVASQKKEQINLLMPNDTYLPAVRLSDNGRWVTLAFSTSLYNRPQYQSGILLWDAGDPTWGPKKFLVRGFNVQDAAVAPDGASVALVDDSSLYLWQSDAKDFVQGAQVTNQLIADFDLDVDFAKGTFSGKSGRGLQYSSNGKWLAMLTSTGIRIFDASSQKLLNGIAVPQGKIQGFLFSPDNKYVVYVVNTDGTEKTPATSSVLRWSLEKPNLTSEIYKSKAVDITAMDISINGKLVIGDNAGYVHVWDINQNTKDSPLPISAHAGRVVNILIGPDDQTVISASDEEGTRLWDLNESGSEAVVERRLPGIVASVAPIIGEDGGEVLAFGGADSETKIGAINIYSRSPDMQDYQSYFSGRGNIQVVVVGSNQKWMAAGRTYNEYYYENQSYLDLWDMNDPKSCTSFMLPSEVAISRLAFYPNENSRYLAVATNNGKVWVEDVEQLMGSTSASSCDSPTIQLPYYALQNDLADVQNLLFTSDGKYLIAAGPVGVRIWEPSKFGQSPYQLPNAIAPVIVSPDKKWLVTAGADNTIQLHDLNNIFSAPVVIPVDKVSLTRFAFNQDGSLLAAANRLGDITIYSLPVKQPVAPLTLQGPFDEISWLEFSPPGTEGTWLVAGSGPAAYLWNMNKPYEKPITLPGGKTGTVMYAGFTDDGKWIITSSPKDKVLQFWSINFDKMSDVACKYAKRNLTPAEWQRYLKSFPERGSLEETCPGLGYGLQQEQAVTNESASTPTPYPTMSIWLAPTPQGGFIQYIIQPGDSLASIAYKYNVDASVLIADNNISDPNAIKSGQILKIRIVATPTPQ